MSIYDKSFGSGDRVRQGKAPEYVFFAAVLQLQVAQEYLTLLKAVHGPYAAAVRRNLSAALAALYGGAGKAGCMAALRERYRAHPALSARESAQTIARIDHLCRRYASLFPSTGSPAAPLPETERFLADTKGALRAIADCLFTAASTQADFMEQYELLRESR